VKNRVISQGKKHSYLKASLLIERLRHF